MADDFRPDADDRIASGEPTETAAYSRRGRRIMTGLVAVAAVLGFGVVLVYAYNKGRQDGTDKTPPVIQAQEGPSKIRPENPGGMKVPNRDKEVFNRLETEKQTGSVERLLPPPEKPMTPPAPPASPTAESLAKVAPAAGAEGTAAVPDKPAVAAAPKAPKVELPPAAPKEVKPLAVAPPKAPPAPPAAKKPATPPKKVAAKTPAAKPKPAAKTGRYRVQMASLKSRAAVQKSWASLKRKHPKLLGNLGLNIQSVNLSGGRGTYYRMQAGPLTSRAQATALCANLKKRKQGCIVVRR